MKDWIQEHYDDNLYLNDILRGAINAAWKAIEAFLL
jgi:hypothetical protein